MADTTPPLVDHPTPTPSRKVMAAGVSGAVAVVIMALAGRFVDLNALAASVGLTPADLQSAVAVIVAAVAGYVVRERARPAGQG